MRYAQPTWKKALTYALIGLSAVITVTLFSKSGHSSANGLMAPNINITLVPRRGTGGSEETATIGGAASGADFSKSKVVVFARTNKWYVQPYINAPYTSIADDGKWQTDTHLGFEYAALLVRSGYKPPATTSVLPQIGGDVLASVRVEGK